MAKTTYEVSGNAVLRGQQTIAAILPDGRLHFENDDDGRYRMQVVKLLKNAGRQNEQTGLFLFDMAGAPPPAGSPPPPTAPAAAPGSTLGDMIATVRELVAAMQVLVKEPCPPMSKTYGDETDEVWRWIARHVEEYNLIAADRQIAIKNNRMR
jgi:hypothetical protein